MKTRFERRTRFARPVGSGRALRGRTSSWRVRCRPRTAGFAFSRGTSRCVGATTQLDHTRTHTGEARVGFETPPREPRLGSGSRGCARGRVRSLESGPAGDSVERSSSRKPRARGLGNAGRTRARDARGAFGAVDFEARVASRRSEARRTRARFRGRAIPRGARRFSGFPRRIRLRPSATVHHEAAGGVEDAQAVHDYQEP